MIHEYKTGRSVCSFTEFLAWVAVVLSGVMLLAAIGTALSSRGSGQLAWVAVVPALSTLLFAMLVIIIVQIARAGMDSSVAAQKTVIEGRKYHEEMMRAMRTYASRAEAPAPAGAPKPSLADVAGKGDPAPQNDPDITEYRGHRIVVSGHGHLVHGVPFATLEKAKAHIDSIAVKEGASDRREPVLAPPSNLS